MNDVTGFSVVDLDRSSFSEATAFDVLRAKYGVSSEDAATFVAALSESKASTTRALDAVRAKYDVSMADYNWYSGTYSKPKLPKPPKIWLMKSSNSS